MDSLNLALPGGATAIMPGRALANTAALHLCVRPEALILTESAGPNTLAATVEATTYRGASRELRLRLADGTAIRATMPAEAPIAPLGSRLRLAWNPVRAVLLDR